MHTISRRMSPLLIAASVLLGSAAVRTQAAQELVARTATVQVGAARAVEGVAQEPHVAAATADSAIQPTVQAPAATTAIPTATRRSSNGLFASLYIGFAATQVLDVHSTLRALDAGHSEANPMMRWATSRPAAFVALKSATTAGTLFVAERLRRHHPKSALLMMAAIDSAYAVVVANNYSVPVPAR
jgi:uncharacterized protein DUF5658